MYNLYVCFHPIQTSTGRNKPSHCISPVGIKKQSNKTPSAIFWRLNSGCCVSFTLSGLSHVTSTIFRTTVHISMSILALCISCSSGPIFLHRFKLYMGQFFCVGLSSICFISRLDSCLQTYVLKRIKTARFMLCLS